MMNRNKVFCLQILMFVLVLFFWQIIGASSEKARFFYSTPYEIFLTLTKDFVEYTFWWNVTITLSELVVGFVCGNVLGIFLGLVLWLFPLLGTIARPYVVALGSVPVFAITPLLILWFGIGFTSKVVIVILSTFFVALFYAYTTALEIGQEYEELIKGFGGKRYDLFQHGRRLVGRLPDVENTSSTLEPDHARLCAGSCPADPKLAAGCHSGANEPNG